MIVEEVFCGMAKGTIWVFVAFVCVLAVLPTQQCLASEDWHVDVQSVESTSIGPATHFLGIYNSRLVIDMIEGPQPAIEAYYYITLVELLSGSMPCMLETTVMVAGSEIRGSADTDLQPGDLVEVFGEIDARTGMIGHCPILLTEPQHFVRQYLPSPNPGPGECPDTCENDSWVRGVVVTTPVIEYHSFGVQGYFSMRITEVLRQPDYGWTILSVGQVIEVRVTEYADQVLGGIRVNDAVIVCATWDTELYVPGYTDKGYVCIDNGSTPPSSNLGCIAGSVLELNTNHPIAGAYVEVVSGPTSASTVTNSQGRFSLCSLAYGDYTIAASKSGYNLVQFSYITVDGPQSCNQCESSTLYLEPVQAAGPDLVVQDIEWTPAQPHSTDTVTLTAVVKNQGSSAAGAFDISISVDGEELGRPRVDRGLAPGQTARASGTAGASRWPWLSDCLRAHTVTAVADASGSVSESNEANNQRQESITVQCQPSDSCKTHVKGRVTRAPIIRSAPDYGDFVMSITEILADESGEIHVGDSIEVRVRVNAASVLAAIGAGDCVEVCGIGFDHIYCEAGGFVKRYDCECEIGAFRTVAPASGTNLDLHGTEAIKIVIQHDTLRGGKVVLSLEFESRSGSGGAWSEQVELRDQNADGVFEASYDLGKYAEQRLKEIQSGDSKRIHNAVASYLSDLLGTYRFTGDYYETATGAQTSFKSSPSELNAQSRGSICGIPPFGLVCEIEKYMNWIVPPSWRADGYWLSIEDASTAIQRGFLDMVNATEQDPVVSAAFSLIKSVPVFGTVVVLWVAYGVWTIEGDHDRAARMVVEHVLGLVASGAISDEGAEFEAFKALFEAALAYLGNGGVSLTLDPAWNLSVSGPTGEGIRPLESTRSSPERLYVQFAPPGARQVHCLVVGPPEGVSLELGSRTGLPQSLDIIVVTIGASYAVHIEFGSAPQYATDIIRFGQTPKDISVGVDEDGDHIADTLGTAVSDLQWAWTTMRLVVGWNLISIGLERGTWVPRDVFDELRAPDVRHWDSAARRWVTTKNGLLTVLAPMQGYWVWSSDEILVGVEGTPLTGEQELVLTKAGWQQIGVPYEIAWGAGSGGTVTIVHDGKEKSLADAVGVGWIHGTASTWDAEEQEWVEVDGEAGGTLDPWRGYWIYTFVDDVTLQFSDEPSLGEAFVTSAGTRPVDRFPTVDEDDHPDLEPSPQQSDIRVINAPNPIRDVHATTFVVQGICPCRVFGLKVSVYGLDGRLVWEGRTIESELDWYAETADGQWLANGMYIYLAQVNIDGQWISVDPGKLAVLR